MHMFLYGPLNIGKSTVVRKTIDALTENAPLAPSGFFTWNGGESDPHIYMKPARSGTGQESFRLASWDKTNGGLICDFQAFEQDGVRLLTGLKDADLIIMDELGFLESEAPVFRQAVLDALRGNVPVLGVLRTGKDIPWHDEIKNDPRVALHEVTIKNRDALPQELASRIRPWLKKE